MIHFNEYLIAFPIFLTLQLRCRVVSAGLVLSAATGSLADAIQGRLATRSLPLAPARSTDYFVLAAFKTAQLN